MRYDKPGCFGHAVTFSTQSSTCRECSEMESCAVAARARLDELSKTMNVDAALKMNHKTKTSKKAPAQTEVRFDADLSETARKIIARLPENAQRTAAALIRTKINFRTNLLEGINPLKDKKPVALALLFDMLLQGPVHRDPYLLALKEVQGHSPAAAASQASIIFSIVAGLGIAVIEDEALTIRKAP